MGDSGAGAGAGTALPLDANTDKARAAVTPAQACGLIHVGDRLVAVNDVELAGLSAREARRVLEAAFTAEVLECSGIGDGRQRHCAVRRTAAAAAHKRLRFEAASEALPATP